MNPRVDEKAHYDQLHATNAFREPRLYPRNWDMSEVPTTKKVHASRAMAGAAGSMENETKNGDSKAEVAFDDWQLNRHYPADERDHPEYFAAF